MLLRNLGILVIPAIALLFAGYMLLEQYIGSSRASTRNYATGIVVFIALFSVLSIVSDLRKLRLERSPDDPGATVLSSRALFDISAFVAATIAFIVALPIFGYVVSFFAYLATILLILKYRPIWKLILIAAATTGFVYGFFVALFGLPLPLGSLVAAFLGR